MHWDDDVKRAMANHESESKELWAGLERPLEAPVRAGERALGQVNQAVRAAKDALRTLFERAVAAGAGHPDETGGPDAPAAD